MKEAWKFYAEGLNQRPIPGKLYSIPNAIGGQDASLVANCVLEALTVEWQKLVRSMKCFITRRPRAILSSKKYKFGSEVVLIQSQSFRAIDFSLLLQLTLFGGKDYKNMRAHEVIKRTNRLTLLHIASQRRMDAIFTISGLSATTFHTTSTVMTCSGKVNIETAQKRNLLGYILDERNHRWKVKLETNETIWMPQLIYNRVNHAYDYDTWHDGVDKRITMYWPIRILISVNCECKMTFNQLIWNNITSDIVHD